ncbi:dUTP diphosphatase [Staphylococcus nepalensis]|uniref:dUTP diphosphatase n=1 Tax=Staphylococcus TaxID=1279 RepID=UPI002DB9A6DB|nr:dUTP diphosphatase [Staphylococcus pseudoxylosus]MEB6038221.1 dUTP diphosphatase [Staphylococcus pseudoxylosus]
MTEKKQLEIKLLSEKATMPERANETDSGLDMYTSEEVTIPPHTTMIVPTDVAINLPYGYEAHVRPRSGVTVKTKLRVAFGTIDQTYNKPIGIITDNISDEAITIEKGKRLAQLVVAPVSYMEAVKVANFEQESNRGAFGSTGY